MNNSVLLFTKTIPITLAIKKDKKNPEEKYTPSFLPSWEVLIEYLLVVNALYSKLTVAGIGVS